MKKIIAGLMVAAAMLTFGCSGRNAAFGDRLSPRLRLSRLLRKMLIPR